MHNEAGKVLSPREHIYVSHTYAFDKRLTDIVISLLALIVLSPLILVLSVLIFIQDGHSPFYKQVRIGQYGKKFGMYKFRSMIFNADQVVLALLVVRPVPLHELKMGKQLKYLHHVHAFVGSGEL